VAEPSGNPPGPPLAARAVPFRPYCGGVVMRTRNVSEYMLVLALCLVSSVLAKRLAGKNVSEMT